MKITKQRLARIIKEEYRRVLRESPDMWVGENEEGELAIFVDDQPMSKGEVFDLRDEADAAGDTELSAEYETAIAAFEDAEYEY